MPNKVYGFDEAGYNRVREATRRTLSTPRVGSQRRRQSPVLTGARATGEDNGGFAPGVGCDESYCGEGESTGGDVCCDEWLVRYAVIRLPFTHDNTGGGTGTPGTDTFVFRHVSGNVWETDEFTRDCGEGEDPATYKFRRTLYFDGDGLRKSLVELLTIAAGGCATVCARWRSCCFIKCPCDQPHKLEDWSGMPHPGGLDGWICLQIYREATGIDTDTSDANCMQCYSAVESVRTPNTVVISLSGFDGLGCHDPGVGNASFWFKASKCFESYPGLPDDCYDIDVNKTWVCVDDNFGGANFERCFPCEFGTHGSRIAQLNYGGSCTAEGCRRWHATRAIGTRQVYVDPAPVTVYSRCDVVLFRNGGDCDDPELTGPCCRYWFEVAVEVYPTYEYAGYPSYLLYASEIAEFDSTTVTAEEIEEWINGPHTFSPIDDHSGSCAVGPHEGECHGDPEPTYGTIEFQTGASYVEAREQPQAYYGGACEGNGCDYYGSTPGGGGSDLCGCAELPALVGTFVDQGGTGEHIDGQTINVSYSGGTYYGYTTIEGALWEIYFPCTDPGIHEFTPELRVAGSNVLGGGNGSANCDPFQVGFGWSAIEGGTAHGFSADDYVFVIIFTE